MTRESAPPNVQLLYFSEIINFPVVETKRYYNQFLDSSDDRPHLQREETEAEMFTFLTLTLQMGHAGQGGLKDYWTKMEQLSCPFYKQTMVRTRYYRILRFLHYTSNNGNGVGSTDDRLGTM
jgi:hypothetical protein